MQSSSANDRHSHGPAKSQQLSNCNNNNSLQLPQHVPQMHYDAGQTALQK
jgi:hypothetical protein